MAERTIIAVCGYKGSGKTTAANELQRIGYTRIRFAQGLKAMLMAFGLTEAQVDGDEKEIPTPLLMGRTPRHAMQTLGTEWGRNLIHPELWVENWRHRVNTTPVHIPIVVDDMRFPNELRVLEELGGSIIYIDRGMERSSAHVSEDLSHITPDYIVMNKGDIRDFEREIHALGLELK